MPQHAEDKGAQVPSSGLKSTYSAFMRDLYTSSDDLSTGYQLCSSLLVF